MVQEYSKYTVELVCSSTRKDNNFFVHSTNTDASFEAPYVYDSVMLYGPYVFSKNGNKTIEPKVSQLLYIFLVSTFRFSGGICGSLFKAITLIKIIKKDR
jgi:hypothetical protein